MGCLRGLDLGLSGLGQRRVVHARVCRAFLGGFVDGLAGGQQPRDDDGGSKGDAGAHEGPDV